MTSTQRPPLAYTVAEVSQMTRIPKTTLRLMIRSGQVPAKKVGRQWLIHVKTAHRLIPDPDDD